MYRTTTLACALLCAQLSAQLVVNFDDNDLSVWNGDIHHFIVNESGQLQLNAENPGESSVYTHLTFFDSLTWEIDVSLDFAPSGSNKLIIWLAMDTTDIDDASGYFLEIGESGSDDAIHLKKLSGGEAVLLASGISGRVASSFDYNLQLEKTSDDLWIMSTTDLNSGEKLEEFYMTFPDSVIDNSNYFGLTCSYTQSRKDAFTFDNIHIAEKVPDTIPPVITEVKIVEEDKICLTFNEKITKVSAENVLNYSFNPHIEIKEATLKEESPKVELILKSAIPGGQIVYLSIQNIEDQHLNISTESIYRLELIEPAVTGDILVNEILFDPYSGGDDFIELINNSEKNINLHGWLLANTEKEEYKSFDQEFILRPNEIVAFSENVDFLKEKYKTPDNAKLIFQDTPSLNNADGNVSIIQVNQTGNLTIDSFNYWEDFHHALLKNTEGVSLERVSLTGKTNDPNNWFSASQLQHFATPGYQNSTRINETGKNEFLTVHDEIFSPDQDGYKDLLIMQYKLDKPGFIANMSIYDDRGRLERRLLRNSSLSTEGLLSWDGLNDEGYILPIGIYIIHYGLYHADGDIISGKKVCVLAQKLE